jgi:hypothetical protein
MPRKSLSSPSVHAVLGRTDLSDWQVLSAAQFLAAGSTSVDDARQLLDLMGLRERAAQLAVASAGRTGWLARRIARLSKAEDSMVTPAELADRIADFLGSEQGLGPEVVVGQVEIDLDAPAVAEFNVAEPNGKLFIVLVQQVKG